jgi:hypothetical protein
VEEEKATKKKELAELLVARRGTKEMTMSMRAGT